MNESTVREYYRLVDRNDFDALLSLFTLNAWYERPGYGRMNGTSDLQRFYSEERVIDVGRHIIDQLCSVGDFVIVQGRFTGLLKDGKSVSLGFADFFEMKGVKISGRRTYFFAALV